MIGQVGLSPGQFAYPRCIDADGATLWIIDKTGRVQRIDPETGRCVQWWRMPEIAYGKPTGVTAALSPSGDRGYLFVADTHYHRVMVYEVDPRPPREGSAQEREAVLTAQFGSFGRGPGEFIFPTDVAVLWNEHGDGFERIYVGEYGGNDRVSIFDGEFRFISSFGRFGVASRPGPAPEELEFNRPQSIQIDSARRELVIADACNHRVGRFTLDGELLGWYGSPGSGAGEFSYPYGIALRPDGTALIVEFGNARVQHVDLRAGTSLGLYGRLGGGPGEFHCPWGLTTIGDSVYVLDSRNDRVVGFRAPRRLARGDG